MTYTPATQYSGPDSFAYRAVDSRGGQSGVATVTIEVRGANLPPAAAADAYRVDEDGTLAATSALANDSDAHGGEATENNVPLTAVLVAGPVHGTLTLATDGTFTYVPAADFNGVDTFTYRAVDSKGAASAPAAVTITVDSVNDAPVAAGDAYAVDEDGALDGASVLANDSDARGGAPDENNVPLTAERVAGPAHGHLTLHADGTFRYAPGADFNGTDTFTYRAVDARGGASAPVTVTIAVNPVNDAPVIGGNPVRYWTTLVPYFYRVDAVDPDGGDSLTYALASAPPWLAIDSATGEIRGTPPSTALGTHRVAVWVTDASGAGVRQTFTLTVTPYNGGGGGGGSGPAPQPRPPFRPLGGAGYFIREYHLDGLAWLAVRATPQDRALSSLDRAPIVLPAASDVRGPAIVSALVTVDRTAAGATVRVHFDELLDEAALAGSRVLLVAAGADGVFGTIDDTIQAVARAVWSEQTQELTVMVSGALPDGACRLVVRPGAVDLMGNRPTADMVVEFRVASGD